MGEQQPPVLDDVIAIAAGAEHSLTLRANGTVVAWGSNTRGESAVPPGSLECDRDRSRTTQCGTEE